MKSRSRISVIIPIFNESESIYPLIDRLLPVLDSTGSYEIIFVNDGSTDNTGAILDEIQQKYSTIIKVIHLRVNCGKSTALQNGFGEASGEIIVMMDGDLQDKPEEIPKLIKYIEENDLDVVTGWKVNRSDPISKTLPSLFYNLVLRWFSGLSIHDFNCGLKVMRRECLEGLTLYGQLHRFMLVLLANNGFRVGELEIEHSPRKYGYSKYGLRRLYHGFMDFMTIYFLTRYLQSPLHFFGFYGLICLLISFLYGGFFLVLHMISIFTYYPQGNLAVHPIWLLSPVMFLVGLIFIFFGIIGEFNFHLISTRLNRSNVKKRVGFKDRDKASECNEGINSVR